MLPVIPKVSLEEEEEGTLIGDLELRTVKVGYLSSDHAQIIKNVAQDDLVAIETQGELEEGIKVRIIGIEEFSY